MYETDPHAKSPLLDPFMGVLRAETEISLDEFRDPSDGIHKVYTTDLYGNQWLVQPGVLLYELPIDERGVLKDPVVTGYVDERHYYRGLDALNGRTQIPQVVLRRWEAYYYGLGNEPVSQLQEAPKVVSGTVEIDPVKEWDTQRAAIAEARARAEVLMVLGGMAVFAAGGERPVTPPDELAAAVGHAALFDQVDMRKGRHRRPGEVLSAAEVLAARRAHYSRRQ